MHHTAMYKNNWFYGNTITMSLNIVVLLYVHYVIVLQIAIKQNLLSAFDTAYVTTSPKQTSIFLCENPIFMSIWVMVYTTWFHHDQDKYKDGIFTEKYEAIQVYFGKVVLLCENVAMYVSS